MKTVTKTVTRIQRAIVIPAKRDRTAIQSISQISADKQFVMGGTFDESVRDFIIDRRDCPTLPDLTEDDWIVYRSGKWQIKTVESFEVDAGWVITAKKMEGEIPEQFHVLRCDHYLSFTDQPTAS